MFDSDIVFLKYFCNYFIILGMFYVSCCKYGLSGNLTSYHILGNYNSCHQCFCFVFFKSLLNKLGKGEHYVFLLVFVKI